MSNNAFQWDKFYNNVSGRQPRELLIDAAGRFGQEPSVHNRRAIDLGCGDGTETAFLLANGWHVLAIDNEPAAFKHLNAKIPLDTQERLQTQIAKFESVTLVPSDMIYAGFSIPFCRPQFFESLWHNIVNNINPGGRFAGQLFGVNDTWASNADMTFLSGEQAPALFTAFEVERFDEEDEDGHSTVGPKHWHVFHVIARKK